MAFDGLKYLGFRLKRRLSFRDLKWLSGKYMSVCMSPESGGNYYDILLEIDPKKNWWKTWKALVDEQLAEIADESTKRNQAIELRRHLLELQQKVSFFNIALKIDDAGIKEAVIKMKYPEVSGARADFILSLLTATVLQLIHDFVLTRTYKANHFTGPFRQICDFLTELECKAVFAAAAVIEDPLARDSDGFKYIDQISSPLCIRLMDIRDQWKWRVSKGEEKSLEASEFVAWLHDYSAALERVREEVGYTVQKLS